VITRSFVCFATASLLFCSSVYAGEYFKWTDESGNLHFSDSLGNVPEKYRRQIETKKFDNEEPEPSPTSEPSSLSTPQESLKKARNLKKSRGDEEGEGKQPKRYEVAYKPYEGSAKRVIVSVLINGTVTAPMAIDTGAPGTILSVSLARKLGLFDESHGRLFTMAGGIGGRAPAVRSIIDTIQVGGARTVFVPTTIIKKMSDSFEGLLGLDFVANYSVTIDVRRKVVIFEELPIEPDHPGGHDQEWWTALFKEFASSRTAWKDYSELLDKKIRESMSSVGNEDIEKKDFADYQCREVGKLFDKLNRYAVQNAVPMHWRTY